MRMLLAAAVAGGLLVLLVACANVATLFIGRNISRQRELAARIALGATRTGLVRSVLVEALLIAVLASVAGLALGAATLKVFLDQAAGALPGLHRVAMDLPVLGAIAALTLAATLLCGAVPAWHALRDDLGPFLRHSAGSRPRAWRVRRALVVAQIAGSCVLLAGAGLLARTVSVLVHEDHGFEPQGAVEAKVVLSDTVLFDGTGREPFVRDLLERVRRMPGVRHAGFGSNLPPRPPPITMAIRQVSENRDETRFMKLGSATPGYLRALGARFVAGRDFDEADGTSGAPAVILSESIARFFFPDGDAVGRTLSSLPAMLRIAGDPRVVGVVGDIKYEGLDTPAGGAIYLQWSRRPFGTGYLIVRAADARQLMSEIRRAARSLDPAIPVPEIQSLQDAVTQSIAARRIRALPAAGFGLLSLAVAFVGVLATLSTLIVERRRDLAIRSAIGASPRRLVWTIVGQGVALVTVGLALGLGLAGAMARLLSSLLYGVSPYDPLTFAGTALLIGGGATLMTYVAAVRARAVDPMSVLRCE
jgi:predicted permease